MAWIINRDKVIELLKKGYELEEWSSGVNGYSYNIGANTVRIETAQKLIKEGKVIQLPDKPNHTSIDYKWKE